MRHFHDISRAAAMALAMVLTLTAFAGKQRRGPSPADQRKADYIFLEAKRQNLKGNTDAYYELLDYAWKLNPDDRFLGSEVGLFYLQLDSTGVDRGMSMLGDYVENNPDDLYKGFIYANLNAQLGETDRALATWSRLRDRFPDRDVLAYRYAGALASTPDSLNRVKAIEIYDSLGRADGDALDIAGRKARVYALMGDTISIRRVTDELLAADPSNAAANLFAAQVYQSLLNNDSAVVFLDCVLADDPSNGLAYYYKANYYMQRGDSVGYDRETFNALMQPDLEMEVKLAMLHEYVAKLYTDSLQQPRINQLFLTLEEQNPHESALHDLYCDYLVAIRDFPGAAEQVSASLDLEPADQSKWRTLASLYFQTKDYERVLDATRRAQHYFPGDYDLQTMEANALMVLDRSEEALAVINRAAAEVDSTDNIQLAQLLGLKGDILYKLERNDEAFQAYDESLRLNPEDAGVMNNAAYYMACNGTDLDRALSLVEHALTLRPDNETTLDTYAWVLFKKKDYERAREVIDRTLELAASPGSDYADGIPADVYEHAGDIYFMSGDPDTAVEFWNDALSLDPDNELLQRKVRHKTYFYK